MGLQYVAGAALILAGIMCIGIAYNNNGTILFRSFAAIAKTQQAGAPSSSPTRAGS